METGPCASQRISSGLRNYYSAARRASGPGSPFPAGFAGEENRRPGNDDGKSCESCPVFQICILGTRGGKFKLFACSWREISNLVDNQTGLCADSDRTSTRLNSSHI